MIIKVKCIDNTDAEEELSIGQVYEAHVQYDFSEFVMIDSQPYERKRFKIL